MYDLSSAIFPCRVIRILYNKILYHDGGRCEPCIPTEGFYSALPLSSLSWGNTLTSPTTSPTFSNLSLLFYEVGTTVPIYGFIARIMRDNSSKECIWSFAHSRHQINSSYHL